MPSIRSSFILLVLVWITATMLFSHFLLQLQVTAPVEKHVSIPERDVDVALQERDPDFPVSPAACTNVLARSIAERVIEGLAASADAVDDEDLTASRRASIFIYKLLREQAELQRCYMQGSSGQWRVIVHYCQDHGYGRSERCGGVGNRLRSASLALLLAALTDRVLIVDHRRPNTTHLEDYLVPRVDQGWIDWRAGSLPAELKERVESALSARTMDAKCKTIVKAIRAIVLRRIDLVRWSFNTPLDTECAAVLVRKLWKRHPKAAGLASAVKKMNQFVLQRIFLRTLFSFSPVVKDAFAEKIATGHDGETPSCDVCVHVRRGGAHVGKGVLDNNRSQNLGEFGPCLERNVLRTSKDSAQLSEVAVANSSWCVLTDMKDDQMMLDLLRPYANSVNASLITTSSIAPVLHLDRFDPTATAASSTTNRGMLRIFVDFYILSQCSVLVGSVSGFNEHAALMHEGGRTHLTRYTVPHANGSECFEDHMSWRG